MTRRSRRAFLRSAGTLAAGSALMPYLPVGVAQEAAPPTRLILITMTNGVDLERWRPQGSEQNWTLSESLAPLAPYKDRMLVMDGVDLEVVTGPGRRRAGHAGLGSLWTGAELPRGDFPRRVGFPTAPSLDHVLGQRLGTTPIYLGGRGAGSDYLGPRNNAHYRGGDGGRINPTMNPRAAFDSLFEGITSGSGTTSDVDALARISERRSVRDVLSSELRRLENATSGLDRQIFQEHLQQMHLLEEDLRRLEARAREGAARSCTVPTGVASFPHPANNSSTVPADLAAQFRVGLHALQCDLSRILCVQWGASSTCGNARFLSEYGYRGFGEIHAHTHEALESEAARQDMANLTTWRMAQIKEQLLDPMDAIDEGNGSLLDNSLVVIASELSAAGIHSSRNVPFVIVQGRNVGYFHTNRYKKWGNFDPAGLSDGGGGGHAGGVPHNGVLVGIANAMGVTDIQSFGDTEVPGGVLEGIA